MFMPFSVSMLFGLFVMRHMAGNWNPQREKYVEMTNPEGEARGPDRHSGRFLILREGTAADRRKECRALQS
jgi:hypothetical protein